MFRDRSEAGRLLAERLAMEPWSDPVVLGAPRGGVGVAAEVARGLEAPLDVVVVRKLRHPRQPELAVGALGEEGVAVIGEASIPRETLDEEIAHQRGELERRVARYRAVRSAAPLEGRDVIVVDDGVATGATMKAAVEVLRQRNPRRIIVALPVAPPQAVEDLARRADRVVCLAAPRDFMAVGQFYENFDQTTDDEVIELLRAGVAREAKARREAG